MAVESGDQTVHRALTGFGGFAAKAERQDEGATRSRGVDFANHRDVAVFGALVRLDNPSAGVELLPAVGIAYESNRSRDPGRGAGERQRAAIAFGVQHGDALVVADPGGVSGAVIGEMGREQRVEAVVRQRSLQRGESDALKHHVGRGIGHDVFLDQIPAVDRRVVQVERGNAGTDLRHDRLRVPLFFRHIGRAVGHHQAEIARAGRVDARIVDLVEDAVAQREPHTARGAERRAEAALRARRPPCRNPRPAWRELDDPIGQPAHRCFDYIRRPQAPNRLGRCTQWKPL